MASKEIALRLFCLPHAGASASAYGRWERLLPRWVHVEALDYPGHGSRLNEPLSSSIREMAVALLPQVAARGGVPYAFFGHSLGALVAYELSDALRASGLPEPGCLFVSGAEAPDRRSASRYARLESPEDLRELLVRLGGTPREAMDDPELMDLVGPMLRSDLAACASYRWQPRSALSIPIHVLSGVDEGLSTTALMGWREHTRESCSLKVYEGGHFFLFEHEREVIDHVRSKLESLRSKPSLEDTDSAPYGAATDGGMAQWTGAECPHGGDHAGGAE